MLTLTKKWWPYGLYMEVKKELKNIRGQGGGGKPKSKKKVSQWKEFIGIAKVYKTWLNINIYKMLWEISILIFLR